MTPYQLEILLWYRSRAVDWESMNAPIWRETIQGLIDAELVAINTHPLCRQYRLTEKGKFYVDYGLCNVPLPLKNGYSIPWPK